MTTIVETTRMGLREFTESDLDDLATMVADEDQMRFYPRPKTRAEASVWINRNLTLYRHYGLGFWLMESVGASDFLGYCGIRPLQLDDVEETEIGWHTRKDFWNRGLATEAAMACRGLAFTRFAIPRLIATIDPAHTASIRVAQKVGMQLEKEAVLDGWPCVVYSVERS